MLAESSLRATRAAPGSAEGRTGRLCLRRTGRECRRQAASVHMRLARRWFEASTVSQPLLRALVLTQHKYTHICCCWSTALHWRVIIILMIIITRTIFVVLSSWPHGHCESSLCSFDVEQSSSTAFKGAGRPWPLDRAQGPLKVVLSPTAQDHVVHERQAGITARILQAAGIYSERRWGVIATAYS